MSDERRLTIGSTSRMSPDEVARHTFATARRGFETAEVRAYLELLAREIHAVTQRERELLDALADAEHRAANPVIDESTLTNALGQE
ncbi:MAG: DivIVA domain-containing protein, partial [Acidobacteriota bacterium]|nr:DivIVA domain-containing protein [Acidobacteriota bacterium]